VWRTFPCKTLQQSKLVKLDKVLYKWFTAMHNLKRLNLFTNKMKRTTAHSLSVLNIICKTLGTGTAWQSTIFDNPAPVQSHACQIKGILL
jgi:hypothetical protein